MTLKLTHFVDEMKTYRFEIFILSLKKQQQMYSTSL
jgi:hypothetical protein